MRIHDRDLLNKTFGKLKVVSRVADSKRAKWLCQCECNNITEVYQFNLLSGATKSCGKSHADQKIKIKRERAAIMKKRKLLSERISKVNKCDMCGNEFVPLVISGGGGNRRFCYECVPNGVSSNLARTKFMMNRLKAEFGNECSLCGYDKCQAALEFHHMNGDNKDGNVSKFIQFSYKKAYEEARKCVLLCANCHREAHNLGYSFENICQSI